MQLKIVFHPLFIIFAFIIVYFGWMEIFLIYMLVIMLHELSHYLIAVLLGYKLNQITFMPYGAGISGNNIFKPSHEIIIALAGPAFNLIISLICIALWWVFPVTYSYTELFVKCNLVLGLFNLIPLFPLDGGRILVAFLEKYTSKLKLYKVMKIVGIVVSVIFAITFLISVFFKINLTYFFISVFLLFSCIDNTKDVYYERTYIKNLDINKPSEVKTYVVSAKYPIHKLVKYIRGNNYTQFLVVNSNHQVIKTLTEKELLDYLQKK